MNNTSILISPMKWTYYCFISSLLKFYYIEKKIGNCPIYTDREYSIKPRQSLLSSESPLVLPCSSDIDCLGNKKCCPSLNGTFYCVGNNFPGMKVISSFALAKVILYL